MALELYHPSTTASTCATAMSPVISDNIAAFPEAIFLLEIVKLCFIRTLQQGIKITKIKFVHKNREKWNHAFISLTSNELKKDSMEYLDNFNLIRICFCGLQLTSAAEKTIINIHPVHFLPKNENEVLELRLHESLSFGHKSGSTSFHYSFHYKNISIFLCLSKLFAL